MSDVDRCPTCGHMHPGKAGLWICGCHDCFLLFDPIPEQYLADSVRERLAELRKLAEARS